MYLYKYTIHLVPKMMVINDPLHELLQHVGATRRTQSDCSISEPLYLQYFGATPYVLLPGSLCIAYRLLTEYVQTCSLRYTLPMFPTFMLPATHMYMYIYILYRQSTCCVPLNSSTTYTSIGTFICIVHRTQPSISIH